MNVREAFVSQGEACAALSSPFMGRLMPLIGERLSRGAVAERILGWQGDPSPTADSVPLRLAGALHALKLEGLALGDVYPPNDVPDNALWKAVETALFDHEARILGWLGSAPQTNEVRRAAALIPALARVAQAYPGQPVELLELGASGGLNLRCDLFRLELPTGGIGPVDSPLRLAPEWRGAPEPGPLPHIASRRGVDLNPLDPITDRLRLLAYIWADQPDRIARTEAAISLARRVPAELTRADAADWAETVLAEPFLDGVRVIYHTIAWQYFPEPTKGRIHAALAAANTPVIEIGMEADGAAAGPGAGLTWTSWPDARSEPLGRADFHGRWVDWQG
ncbi:MAG: DUF2332 family protein [Silicimonas sp.]|nr:DUF2332 family protein [Silicimonas sp.]